MRGVHLTIAAVLSSACGSAVATEATGEDDTGSSAGGADCEPLPADPVQPPFSWCTSDLSQAPPNASFLETCLDAFVSFRQGEDLMGFSFYEGYAQFYTVSENGSGQEFLSVLEPFDGTLDDCGLYGSEGDGGYPDVTFADVGSVRFSFGDASFAAEPNTSASVIAYFESAAAEGLEPQFLAPHGFSIPAAGVEQPGAVILPEPIVITSPATDGTGVVDRGAFTITWEPSESGLPLELSLSSSEGDAVSSTLFCRVEDDGELMVPAELACHLSPQDSVALVLMRTDRALVTTEDGRNVIVTAEVSNRLSVTLQ